MAENLPDTNVGNIEYIRKADAVDAVNHALDRETILFSFVRKVAISALKKIAPADAAPVVHAYWIDTENYYRRWRCSACSGHTKEAHPPVCPFCGAKMDGEE